MELTIVDLSAKPPPWPQILQFIETDEAKRSAEPPKDKTFESNANSIAASKLPATGQDPLPTQQGRDLPFIQTETHPSSRQRGRETATNPTAARNEVYTGAESTRYADAESFGNPENHANAGSCNDAGTGAVCHVDSNAAAGHP